jgi:hypothetical protein
MPATDGSTLLRAADTPVKNSSGDTWSGVNTQLSVLWQLQNGVIYIPFGVVHKSLYAAGTALKDERIGQTFLFPMTMWAPPAWVLSAIYAYAGGIGTYNQHATTPVVSRALVGNQNFDRIRSLYVEFRADDTSSVQQWAIEGLMSIST